MAQRAGCCIHLGRLAVWIGMRPIALRSIDTRSNEHCMRRRRPVGEAVRFILAVAVLLGGIAPAQARLTAEDGLARDPDNARLLYREAHLIRREGERPVERLVMYRCPSGAAFARKRVDYRDSVLAPAFELVDARGYREGLRREAGRVVLWTGAKPGKPLKPSASATPLVADAGFDEFLRAHWASLAAGRPQPLAFAVPAYGRSLALKVRSSGVHARDGDRMKRFELRLDGLLGAVAPTIRVEYDVIDKRLRRFHGPTNIRDHRGSQIKAEIDFPQPPRMVDAQHWRAALDEPLTRCALGEH
jgi:hypothetical protein